MNLLIIRKHNLRSSFSDQARNNASDLSSPLVSHPEIRRSLVSNKEMKKKKNLSRKKKLQTEVAPITKRNQSLSSFFRHSFANINKHYEIFIQRWPSRMTQVTSSRFS